MFLKSSSAWLPKRKVGSQLFTMWCDMNTAGLESCSQMPDCVLHFTSHLLLSRAGQKVSCLIGAHTSINIRSCWSTVWKTVYEIQNQSHHNYSSHRQENLALHKLLQTTLLTPGYTIKKIKAVILVKNKNWKLASFQSKKATQKILKDGRQYLQRRTSVRCTAN